MPRNEAHCDVCQMCWMWGLSNAHQAFVVEMGGIPRIVNLLQLYMHDATHGQPLASAASAVLADLDYVSFVDQ
jgi:hypothetical protein